MNKLRVWWIPQVGKQNLSTFRKTKPFYIPVGSVEEGKLVLETLAFYDCYLYNQNIRGDYCNTGGLQMLDPEFNDWVDWYDEETGEYDLDVFAEENPERFKEILEAEEIMRKQVNFDAQT